MKEKKTESPEGRMTKNERIETYLQKYYDFRFNVVKSKPEFRDKETNNLFSPVSKFDINSFKLKMNKD